MAIKKRIFKTLAIIACYLAAWELISLLVGKELLFPAPFTTLARFFELLGERESWMVALLTLLRVMGGFLCGVVCGALLGVLTARFPLADALLAPLRGVVKATPVTSFILLALLWIAGALVPMFIAFLMVVPIVWTNTADAILHTDNRLVEMGRAFGFSRTKIIKKIYIPSVLPQFLAACTTALGFAWKSGVAAEIIALPKNSVGYMLYESKLHIETVDLFAWTLLVVLLSMLLEFALVRCMRRIRHD